MIDLWMQLMYNQRLKNLDKHSVHENLFAKPEIAEGWTLTGIRDKIRYVLYAVLTQYYNECKIMGVVSQRRNAPNHLHSKSD